MRKRNITLGDYNTLLQVVRLGIGHYADRITGVIDWDDLQAHAARQGLSAIVLDGVDKLPANQRPPQAMLLEWIGEVLQNYEQRYELCRKSIVELASFYNEHGYKMMVLKGYACSLDWPKPEHRPCGDVDIWLFGKQKEADATLSKDKGIKIDKSHHHHTVFYWCDFMVENHYDFVNTKDLKSSKELEVLFKEFGKDDSHFVEIKDSSTGSTAIVYMPSPNLHALFLIRHMVSHFVGSNITLRQVLDWAFFVEKHTKEIDWVWLVNVVERYHMKDFYNCINAICVEDLGFPVEIFKTVQFEPRLKDRVLNDIISPAYETEEPRRLLKRIEYKYRRWQGNAWKQELCYNESRWSAFWSGVWAKLLKPRSI